jgi:CRP/FNR family transcriptional regulator, cyclic AMP receptor protein
MNIWKAAVASSQPGDCCCQYDGVSVKSVFLNARVQRTLEPGQAVFTQGDAGTEMFGIVSGAIELTRGGQPVARIGEGATFGELAIVTNTPRNLTAVAVEPTVIAVIDERTFLFLVHETPMFAMQVMRSMAELIQRLDEQLYPAASPADDAHTH